MDRNINNQNPEQKARDNDQKEIDLLRKHLPAEELTVRHSTLINQYPQKIWLAEDLVSLYVVTY